MEKLGRGGVVGIKGREMSDKRAHSRPGRSLRPVATEFGEEVAAERVGIFSAAGFDGLLSLAPCEVVDLFQGSSPASTSRSNLDRGSCGQRFAAVSIARPTAGVSVI